MTRTRYSRIAPIYDLLEVLAEVGFKPMRERLWQMLNERLPTTARILEVGVGTGKNIPFWPTNKRMTAIDLTPGMLQQAARRANALDRQARFGIDDAQSLSFQSNSFDGAAASFVFCSVPDPVLGLEELKRVVRPGGSIMLLEHVRSKNRWLGKLMDLLNPIVVRIVGANINRDTLENVRHAGLQIDQVENLAMGRLVKLIVARSPES
jgi:ubiquinone/menaquinone biosynthesis C-methylase UbiE